MPVNYDGLARLLRDEEFRLWDYSHNDCCPTEVERIKERILNIKMKMKEMGSEYVPSSFSYSQYFPLYTR